MVNYIDISMCKENRENMTEKMHLVVDRLESIIGSINKNTETQLKMIEKLDEKYEKECECIDKKTGQINVNRKDISILKWVIGILGAGYASVVGVLFKILYGAFNK